MKNRKTIKRNLNKQNLNKQNLNKRFLKNLIRKFQKSVRRFWYKIHVVMICVVLLGSGCGNEVSVLKGGDMEDSTQTENTENNDIKNKDTEQNELQEEIKNEIENEIENEAEEHLREHSIFVDVGGAVKHPGMYRLAEDSRVFEAIALAGGFTEDAYVKNINQAKCLMDGEQIYVYTVSEIEERWAQEEISDEGKFNSNPTNTEMSNKINLNRANKADLMTLAGIGATRADAILQYRAKHGGFRSIEELMQVEGIKEKTYEKIKDCITVQ